MFVHCMLVPCLRSRRPDFDGECFASFIVGKNGDLPSPTGCWSTTLAKISKGAWCIASFSHSSGRLPYYLQNLACNYSVTLNTKMKLYLFLVLLQTASASRLGRALKNANLPSRNLQTCESVGDIVKNLATETMGTGVMDCQVLSEDDGCAVTCSSVPMCCQDICGTLDQKFHYDTDMKPVSEVSCVNYADHASHDLGGLTRCIETEFCDENDNNGQCGCNAKISGLRCTSCSICGDSDAEGFEAPFAVSDCSNINGGSLFNGQCDDVVDIDAQVLDFALQCKDISIVGAEAEADAGTDVDADTDTNPIEFPTEVDEPNDKEEPDDTDPEPETEIEPLEEVAKENDPSWNSANRTGKFDDIATPEASSLNSFLKFACILFCQYS